MPDPLTELDEILKARQALYDGLMEGTQKGYEAVALQIRPRVRAWHSKVLLVAELGEPLQKYLRGLPQKWRDQTEVLLEMRDDPALLPAIMRNTAAPELEGLTLLVDPTPNQWSGWLEEYGERVGLSMRRPFNSTRRPLLTAARVVGALVASTALVYLGMRQARK